MGQDLSTGADRHLDTIPRRLQFWSETQPDRELFVFYSGQVRQPYTSRRVFELSGKFAHRLRSQYGFRKGDIIVNTLPNSPERLFTDVGILLAGCSSLNGGTMFSDGSDFLTSARNSQLRGAIVCPEGNSPAWRILEKFLSSGVNSSSVELYCETAPEMRTAVLVSRQPDSADRKPFLLDLQDGPEQPFVEPDISQDDIANIFTTSGSTGYCKLVAKSHFDILQCAQSMQKRFHEIFSGPVPERIVYYSDRPIGWSAGYPYGTYLNANTHVLLDVFDSLGSKVGADAWDIMCREKANFALMMPIDFNYMVTNTARGKLESHRLKMIIGSGQPFRKTQLVNYSQVADHVGITYGSTEAICVTLSKVDEKHLRDYFCGKVLDGMQLRVVDDQGNLCPPERVGTVHVTGKWLFRGYFNKMEQPDPKTLTAFTEDGWMNTDDNGFTDDDGNYYVIGRLKDVITYGATFVYPSWLEPKIAGHPDIEEAVIVPVSDPTLIHNICAVVQPASGSQMTQGKLEKICQDLFMNDASVEGTPVPKYFMILNSLPKTQNGKTDKLSIQRLAEQTFGVK